MTLTDASAGSTVDEEAAAVAAVVEQSSGDTDTVAAARVAAVLSPAAIDGLLADAQASGLAVDGPGGLIQQMIGAVLERALETEMADHLGYERGEAPLASGLGYLLKERVSDADTLLDALRRVAAGECVIDPEIVTRLMNQQRHGAPVSRLSQREREILALMAQGRSNIGIANELGLSERTVESASAQLIRKLDLEPDPNDNRRVLAVLALLRK